MTVSERTSVRCATFGWCISRCPPLSADAAPPTSIDRSNDRNSVPVSRPSRQRSERGGCAGETVGGLAERPVTAEDDDDFHAVQRSTAGEPGRVAATRRFLYFELVVGPQHPLDEHPPPRGHRRRRLVDDQEQPHLSPLAPLPLAPYWHAYDPGVGRAAPGQAALTALTAE